ncbi:MAG TPA: SPFH domain-containing protein [Candidatus Limnocylindrales bacterium]|nr:SPFH domain-containing protein [Candidatus Limnocylindrales bacterium]
MGDILNFVGSGVIPIFLIIIVAVLIVSYIGSRYKVAGANEALIVSGQRDRGPDGRRNLKVVRGGGVIVLPLVHKVGKLKLTARQINVSLADAVTRQGIKVAVQGVATVKIGADDESIRNAAERFLEAHEEQVDSIVKNVLEGSLRSIVGTLTVEELNLDRQKFQQAVQDAAKGDLATSGLQIDSFTIQAIRDESGYMELIGQQETARRERDARMAKAAADQEAAVREAEAEQVKINAARDVSLRRAETETQTAAANARAAQAGPLAEAEATQEVTRKQTELAELDAARTQKELLTSTVRPAEAEAEAQVRRAEGEKQARIAAAQADAERVKLAGEAQARVVEVTAEATAKQTTLEGNAEAGIVLSKGEAEAKALALRAEAYRQFNEAAIIQTVLSMLPDIVRAAAEPMGNIDNLTVLSNDGASDVVRNVTRTVTEAGTTVKGLTGIDIPQMLSQAMGAANGGAGGAGGGGGGGGGGGRTRSSTPRSGGGGTGRGTGPTTGTAQASGTPSAPVETTPPVERRPAATSGRPAPASVDLTTPVAGAAPRFESQEQIDAALEQADKAIRAATGSTPRTDTAAGPARPARTTSPARPGSTPIVESAAISRETTVDDAAQRLANDLRRIPGIERFAAVRLGELERSGPRPLRTMWRIASENLDAQYGQLTIGELLEMYSDRRS